MLIFQKIYMKYGQVMKWLCEYLIKDDEMDKVVFEKFAGNRRRTKKHTPYFRCPP